MSTMKKLATLTLLAVGGTVQLGYLVGGAAQAEPTQATSAPSGKGAAPSNTPASEAPRTPDEALKRLMEGNARFVAGRPRSPNRDLARIRATAPAQKPFAIVVGCSDSRVPNEIIFDQGIGDLFVVRTAGQVSTYASYGSIEFGEEVLGAKLIMVLGHTKCGAVKAAVELPEVPGHIITLINAIRPAAERARDKPGDVVENAIHENVREQVAQLSRLEPVLARRVREGSVKVVGAVYDIETGRVELVR